MHQLVLKLENLNTNYRLSKLATKTAVKARLAIDINLLTMRYSDGDSASSS